MPLLWRETFGDYLVGGQATYPWSRTGGTAPWPYYNYDEIVPAAVITENPLVEAPVAIPPYCLALGINGLGAGPSRAFGVAANAFMSTVQFFIPDNGDYNPSAQFLWNSGTGQGLVFEFNCGTGACNLVQTDTGINKPVSVSFNKWHTLSVICIFDATNGKLFATMDNEIFCDISGAVGITGGTASSMAIYCGEIGAYPFASYYVNYVDVYEGIFYKPIPPIWEILAMTLPAIPCCQIKVGYPL